MNKLIFLFTLLFSLTGNFLFAQTDEEMIKATLINYLDGGTNGDPDQFKSAFVADAVQRSIGSKGTVIGMTVESLASKIKPGQKMDRETNIISWSYAGISATAITETKYPTSKIIDMLNLLKIGNEWKIVTRVYSRIESDEEVTSSSPVSSVAKSSKPGSSAAKVAPAPKKKPVADDGW